MEALVEIYCLFPFYCCCSKRYYVTFYSFIKLNLSSHESLTCSDWIKLETDGPGVLPFLRSSLIVSQSTTKGTFRGLDLVNIQSLYSQLLNRHSNKIKVLVQSASRVRVFEERQLFFFRLLLQKQIHVESSRVGRVFVVLSPTIETY